MGSALGNMRIMYKILIILGIAVVGMLLMGIQSSMQLRDNLLDDRKVKTRHVVETAHSLVLYFADQASVGALSGEEARKQAMQAVKGLRYEEKEYFWINDMHSTMLMHPYKPKLDGQDLSGFKDPNGKKVFVEFVDAVREGDGGFVDYLWPKPEHDEPVAKISYVKSYSPWGWIIGSGVYLDDIEDIFWGNISKLLGMGAIIILVLSAASWVIVKAITQPLNRVKEVIIQVESAGDLKQSTDIKQNDEVGVIAAAFDAMLVKFQQFIAETKQAADQVAVSADKLGLITDRTSQEILNEQNQTEQVATAMNEMTATVQEVSRNAAQAAQSAQEADQETSAGKQVVDATMNSIDQLAREVENATGVIHKLEEDTESIGKVLDVIRGIAEQTNLLALNAAIEAARAGDQGRGFAVVADEVRTLAQRTQESTQEIQQMIETLQSCSQNAVRVMESGRNQAQDSVTQAAKAGESLDTITQVVARISDMNTQIASAAEEQGVVAEEILRNVVAISEGAQKNSIDAQETAAAGHELKTLSDQLENQISVFHG